MKTFDILARYATRGGRPGDVSCTVQADDSAEAMDKVRKRLWRRGCSKIDMQAWEVTP